MKRVRYLNPPRSSQSGSVLILALWVVFFLAALTVATGAHVSAVLNAAERMTERVQARSLAAAGAAQAAAVIMRQTNTWDGLSERAWNRDETMFREVPLADGGVFSVVYVTRTSTGGSVTNFGVCGEEGKINLNRASHDLLTSLFSEVAGAGAADTEALAAAVLRWRGEDKDERLTEGAKPDYYPPNSSVSEASAGPLKSVEELLLIDGMTEALYARLIPLVTVYGTGLVNINAAQAAVLTVLALAAAGEQQAGNGAGASLADKIVRFREAGNAFEKADYAAMRSELERFSPLTSDEGTVFAAMMGALTVRSTAFSGTAYGRYSSAGGGNPVLRVEFVWNAQARRGAMWRER